MFCFLFHKTNWNKPETDIVSVCLVGTEIYFCLFRGLPSVSDTSGKIATGINDTGANLPPVSTTPAANFATSFTSVVDTGADINNTGGKQWD